MFGIKHFLNSDNNLVFLSTFIGKGRLFQNYTALRLVGIAKINKCIVDLFSRCNQLRKYALKKSALVK